jgi:hypothetical protein
MLHGAVFQMESVLDHDVAFPIKFDQRGLVDDVLKCVI